MNELKDKMQSIKKRKLIIWCVRQLLTGCIVIPVVIKWPNLKWLIPAWIIVGTTSLVVMLLLFRKLQDKMEHLGSMLEKIDDDKETT